ncbi:hypothetical protein [Microbulbifer discodermiae]|uniref:hypothetical protein n=1 Tax=Microbulbifer sp. 2201CG32-9 TaxID=3232309 RepID=UPI00345C1AE9
MIKAALKSSFGGFTGTENVTLSEERVNALPAGVSAVSTALGVAILPHLEQKGSIKPWLTSYAPIPEGWQLADGTNDTPDLRGRAVIGADTTYEEGSNYGSATADTSEAGDHNHDGKTEGHTLTIEEIPEHGHGAGGQRVLAYPGNEGSNFGPDYDPSDKDGETLTIRSEGGGKPHAHGIPDSGKHKHQVSTIPPSMALSWIIKTSEVTSESIGTAIADAMIEASLSDADPDE